MVPLGNSRVWLTEDILTCKVGDTGRLLMNHREAVPEQVMDLEKTFHVEQLVLDRDLRRAPSLRFAVDHPLLVRMGLQIHEASLHVIKDVRPIGRDLLGWELPVERDFG